MIISRMFNAPRDPVFRVYTDPATSAQWWGLISWVRYNGRLARPQEIGRMFTFQNSL